MRKLVAILCVFALAGVANADFTGDYAPGNWTLNNFAGGSGTLTESTMTVVGGDIAIPGDVEYAISVPANATLSFDWNYSSGDTGTWDHGYYSVNDVQTFLADNGSQGGGSSNVNVSSGDTFALGVTTDDGGLGPGTLTVTNFVPEPASLALLGMGALALLRRRR